MGGGGSVVAMILLETMSRNSISISISKSTLKPFIVRRSVWPWIALPKQGLDSTYIRIFLLLY
jgi:hypothetical protein